MMQRDKLYVVTMTDNSQSDIHSEIQNSFKGVYTSLDKAVTDARNYIELIKRDCISQEEFDSSNNPYDDFGDEILIFNNWSEDIRDDSAFFEWSEYNDLCDEIHECNIDIIPINLNDWINDD